jgi:hypothetical protein
MRLVPSGCTLSATPWEELPNPDVFWMPTASIVPRDHRGLDVDESSSKLITIGRALAVRLLEAFAKAPLRFG